MPERSHGTEEKKPPIVIAIEATKKHADEGIEKSEPFKEAVKKVEILLGSSTTQDNSKAAHELVKSGVHSALNHITMLPNFATLESKKQTKDNLKYQHVDGSWINVLDMWNPDSDKFGVGALRKCISTDKDDMIQKGKKETKTLEAYSQLKKQADAIAIGQKLIIDYYQAQTASAAGAKAA